MMQRRKFFSLKFKTLLAILPLVALFLIFCFLTVQGGTILSVKKSLKNRASALSACASMMANEALSPGASAQQKQRLQTSLERFVHLPDVSSAEIINNDGKIRAHSNKSKIGQNDFSSFANASRSSGLENVEEISLNGKNYIAASVPIRHKDQHLGVAIITLSAQEADVAVTQIKRSMLGLTLVLLSGAILFAAFITYSYGNPLLVLAQVANSLAQGELDTRADAARGDEVGLIAAGINRLAANLQSVLLREQNTFQSSQERIRELRTFTEGVLQGDLDNQARVEYIDEIGQLAMSINEIVRHMRGLREELTEAKMQAASSPSPAPAAWQPTPIPAPELSDSYNRPLPQYGQRPSRRRPQSQLNRVPEEAETIISMAAPTPSKPVVAAVQTNLEIQQPAVIAEPEPAASLPPATDNSLISIESNYGLSQAGELNSSQKEYVSKLNQLGYGQTALVATGGTEDSYPFLRAVLESEGFSVIHASTVAEMIDIATVIGPQLIMVEFNDMASGNQHAVNKLRSTKECSHTSLIILEATIRSKVPYASMKDIIQIIIPNSDEELAVMIREALAEILLVGGMNPFLSQDR